MTKIVFLHIPKTAGQTVHAALQGLVGRRRTSPVRVHTEAGTGAAQFPPGYDLYSGHLDWDALETLPEDRFVFTVLRDPCERIASFYFFLLKEAQALSEAELQRPERIGMRTALMHSADDYFFGGDAGWQRFIRDHYDNVYCSYLATRRMLGSAAMDGLDPDQRVAAARVNLPLIDKVYSTLDLGRLEQNIEALFGKRISVADTFINTGDHEGDELRWPKLTDRFENDRNIRRLEEFVVADEQLLSEIGLKV